jgi:myosin heavy subunit
MNWRQVSVACLFVAASSLTLVAQAQTEDIRTQISNLEREQSTLNQQVAAKQKQIDTLRSRPSPEQKELADAKRAVDEARAVYKQTANADTESKLKNAEFKYTLAERKYDKSNGDVAALANEIDGLKLQMATKQRQVKTLQQQAAEQATAPKPAAVDPRQQQKLAEDRARQKQQEQELEKTKQQNDAAQKEIERLKALLASKETANSASPAAVAKATPAVATTTAVAATPVVAKAAAATGGDGLRQLSSTGDVVSELQAVSQRLSGDTKRTKQTNEVVHFKRQQGGKDVDKSMVTLKALGSNQFRGKAALDPGSYEVVLGTTRWKTDISSISSKTDFVVLLDNSDAAKPKLSFYNQALEGR